MGGRPRARAGGRAGVSGSECILSDEAIEAIDRAVGEQVRRRRVMLGLSQDEVSKQLGLTFQQLHKYEKGINRISASRLYQIATILGVPVSYFFKAVVLDAFATPGADDAADETVPQDVVSKRQAAELVRDFYALPNDEMRAAVQTLLKAFGAKPN